MAAEDEPISDKQELIREITSAMVTIHRDTIVTVRARLTEPIDILEEELAKQWLTDPAREALAALVAFRDGDLPRG